ncbi:MAG: YbaN family protein [Pseudomonadota bacterium]
MRAVWILVGLIALGLGTLGVVLPLLPTTPFVLLAAFAFARSSDRLHAWLLRHRIFGKLIHNWNENGSISRQAKIVSAISMAAVFALSVALNAKPIVLIIQAVVLSASALFVLTRPAPLTET